MTLDKVGEADRVALDFFARLLAGISIVALVLATAGVYALMSFTVARRTAGDRHPPRARREPATHRHVHVRRALAQVTIGLMLGSIPAADRRRRRPEVAPTNGNKSRSGHGPRLDTARRARDRVRVRLPGAPGAQDSADRCAEDYLGVRDRKGSRSQSSQ